MSKEPEGSNNRPSRFFDAVQALSTSIRGRSLELDRSDSSSKDAIQSRLVLATQPKYRLDSFPNLTEDHLARILQLDETSRSQVMAAYDESKLNWDLDPMLVGGNRSDTNIGMAVVFDILCSIGKSDHDTAAASSSEEARGSGVDANGNVIPAPSLPGQSESKGDVGGSANRDNEAKGTKEVFQRQFETHDLLRAIDKKDTQLILTIRDANFDLLLDLNQGGAAAGGSMSSGTVNTPLGYCIGLGKGWEGVAVVLTGALSRFINNLPDEEEDLRVGTDDQKRRVKRSRRELDPRTMNRLRKLRTSLKLAIDYSIAIDQTRLLSSYLQVLLMSTGQTFIRETTDSVHQALLTHHSGSQVSSTGVIRSNAEPIQVAYQAITSFFTDSLKTKAQTKDVSQRIASVDDLIDNCVCDFIIMAIWQDIQLHRKEVARVSNEEKRNQILTRAEDEQLCIELPTWSFARDDRIVTIFAERVWSLSKVLDTIEWDSPNYQATSSTKQARHPKIWKCAKNIVEEMSARKNRLTSKDRLSILRNLVH